MEVLIYRNCDIFVYPNSKGVVRLFLFCFIKVAFLVKAISFSIVMAMRYCIWKRYIPTSRSEHAY